MDLSDCHPLQITDYKIQLFSVRKSEIDRMSTTKSQIIFRVIPHSTQFKTLHNHKIIDPFSSVLSFSVKTRSSYWTYSQFLNFFGWSFLPIEMNKSHMNNMRILKTHLAGELLFNGKSCRFNCWSKLCHWVNMESSAAGRPPRLRTFLCSTNLISESSEVEHFTRSAGTHRVPLPHWRKGINA